jgi:hypothetical protein
MSTPRIWLTGMTTNGNGEYLKEGITPILEFFHGLVWTFHDPKPDDEGYQFLIANKGEGQIIARQWVQRHHISMNETLWCGVIQPGDLIVLTDTLEYISPAFAAMIGTEINQFMQEIGADALFYYGKPFIIKYNEYMEYQGSPHFYLMGVPSGAELSKLGAFSDENRVRKNMRPIKRPDPYHFVDHYVKYFLYPAGANCQLLGLEKNGDPKQLFPILEQSRLEFRQYLREKELPLTVEGVKLLMENLDEQGLAFFNKHKELNDFYRYYKLGRRDFKDDHDFKNVVVIQ